MPMCRCRRSDHLRSERIDGSRCANHAGRAESGRAADHRSKVAGILDSISDQEQRSSGRQRKRWKLEYAEDALRRSGVREPGKEVVGDDEEIATLRQFRIGPGLTDDQKPGAINPGCICDVTGTFDNAKALRVTD